MYKLINNHTWKGQLKWLSYARRRGYLLWLMGLVTQKTNVGLKYQSDLQLDYRGPKLYLILSPKHFTGPWQSTIGACCESGPAYPNPPFLDLKKIKIKIKIERPLLGKPPERIAVFPVLQTAKADSDSKPRAFVSVRPWTLTEEE